MENKPSVCVISFPMPSSIVVNTFLNSLLKILLPICEKNYLVTSNISLDTEIKRKIILKDIGNYLKYKNPKESKFIFLTSQALRIIYIQIKMSFLLIMISKDIDIVLFYVGGSNLFLPILTAKCLNKRVITSALGLGSMSYKKNGKSRKSNLLACVLNIIEKNIFFISDSIIVESESAIKFLNLEKFHYKIESNGSRFIDTENFKIKNPIDSRDPLIGYIGRLEEGKGIIDLIEAIPLVLKNNKNLNFIIIGDGPLYPKVKKLQSSYPNNVCVVGWVSHKEIANMLNRIKFLVLPSYSEGLPTVVLEAMACGSVVISTSVGAIPDVITDGKSGFIIKNNSSKCIANTIMKASNCCQLPEIVTTARKIIEDKFTFKAAVTRYSKIIQ